MRAFFYWFTVTALAVLAVGASAQDHSHFAEGTLWNPEANAAVQAVPEPSRAVLLGVGIIAMAFTYRRAWLNLSRSSK